MIDEDNKAATYTRLADISDDMMVCLNNPEISLIDLKDYVIR